VKPRACFVGAVALGLCLLNPFTSPGSAFDAYRLAAAQQFHLEPKRVTCQFCHVNPDGGDPWNTFGQLVQAKLTGNINVALFEALNANRDSDGDGYRDALEVFAGTLPGNKDSAPLVRLEVLSAAFEKAGGVNQYRP
jgi:hypothetical protein